MKDEHKRLLKIILISLSSLAVMTLISNYFFYRYFFALGQESLIPDYPEESEDETINGDSPGENLYREDEFSRNIVNIMLLGIDRSSDRQREGREVYFPDTVKIVSLDLKEDRVRLISVLRDTYTYLPDANVYDKLANAYVYAYKDDNTVSPHQQGVQALKEALRHFLGGVPIHYHLTVDMDGAARLVDALGGVEYELEEPLRDDFGTGKVVVPEGRRYLDGEEFLYLLRYRGQKGDAWRVEQQQTILKKALEQMQENNSFAEIPRIYSILRRSVDTDLSTGQIGFLAWYGAELDPDRLDIYTFESEKVVSERNDREVLYAVPDEEHRVEIIQEVFNREEVVPRIGYWPPASRPLDGEDRLLDYPSPVLLEEALP